MSKTKSIVRKESQRLPVVRYNVPVAPNSGSHVTHVQAFRRQPDFPMDATTRLVSGTNPWRPGGRAWPMWSVLVANPVSTVGEILDIAWKTQGIVPVEGMEHLRWLFTWGGSYIEIGGELYSPPPINEIPPERRKKRRRA